MCLLEGSGGTEALGPCGSADDPQVWVGVVAEMPNHPCAQVSRPAAPPLVLYTTAVTAHATCRPFEAPKRTDGLNR